MPLTVGFLVFESLVTAESESRSVLPGAEVVFQGHRVFKVDQAAPGWLIQHLGEDGLVQALLQVGVKSILDRAVRAARQLLRHFAPSDALDQVQSDDQEVLLERPFALVDAWIEMIVPSLPTLLSYAAREVLRYSCPVSRAIFFDAFCESFVFLFRPVAHDESRAVGQLQPSRVALDLGFAGQQFADSCPRILAELGDIR